MKKSDEAWAARKVERGDGRACNPETEFRLGFAAGTVDPFRWRGLYAIAAKRAAQYELVLREAGLPVGDALERDVFSAEDVAAAKAEALEEIADEVRLIPFWGAEGATYFDADISRDYVLDKIAKATQ